MRDEKRGLKELLEHFYLEGELTLKIIAEIFEVSEPTPWRWLGKFKIPTRTMSEAQGGITKPGMKGNKPWNKGLYGKNNPYWKGGGKNYHHSQARRVWEEYWREKVPDGYDIHHVDRNIANNDICNLALLTKSFHAKIHNKIKNMGKRW